MLKVLMKQEEKWPFPACLEANGLSQQHLSEKRRKADDGAQLVSSAWGLSFLYHFISHLTLRSPSRPNDTPIIGSRSHPGDAEPVVSPPPAHEVEERRERNVISPAEIRTTFCFGSSVCWSLYSGPSF